MAPFSGAGCVHSPIPCLWASDLTLLEFSRFLTDVDVIAQGRSVLYTATHQPRQLRTASVLGMCLFIVSEFAVLDQQRFRSPDIPNQNDFSQVYKYKCRIMTQTCRENEREKKKREVRMSVRIQESRYVYEMSVHNQESVRIRNVCPHLMSTRIQSLSTSDSVRRSSSKCHRPISTSGPIASAHRPVVPDTTSSPDMFERQNADLVVANHQARPSPPTMQNPTQRPSSPT